MRRALDCLVVDLARLGSGERSGHEGIGFPVEDDAEQFESIRSTLLLGVSEEHCDQLATYQPFNGVEWPWHLLVLANPLTSIDCITSVSGGRYDLPAGTDLRRVGTATYTFTAFLGDPSVDEHVELPIEGALLLAHERTAEVLEVFETDFT